jgi:hypothetical protein
LKILVNFPNFKAILFAYDTKVSSYFLLPLGILVIDGDVSAKAGSTLQNFKENAHVVPIKIADSKRNIPSVSSIVCYRAE